MIIIKNVIVKKYGGSSLSTVKRIQSVAKQIKESYSSNLNIVIVVSAMGSETNRLINLVKSISQQPAPRELDMLLSTGEQKSIALLTVALNAIGIKAKSFAGHQSKVLTNNRHNNARILEINTEKILNAIEQGFVCVVAGFQGITSIGEITTLGRGGSDTTAVALAAALDAEICEIYTDVDGVYTMDPNNYSKAKKINKITYNEMLELSILGAQVIHPRAVEIAAKFNIPLIIKSSFISTVGTIIHKEENKMENFTIKGITVDNDTTYFSISKLPKTQNLSYQLINEVNKRDISIDMVVQNFSPKDFYDLSFTVSKKYSSQVKAVCELFNKENSFTQLYHSTGFSKISVVGLGINNHPEVLGAFLKCLADFDINIECLTTSQMKISCLIDQRFSKKAVESLHNTLFPTLLIQKNL
ncbi:MAG TPA: aspartate kinase [Clostridia bacterium]|nr:aspartate kinase [Clostridia bacterium]